MKKFMKQLIYSFILTGVFLTGSEATTWAKSILNASHTNLLKVLPGADGLTKTYIGSNEILANENDGLKNNSPQKIKSSQIKVNPSVGSCQGGCNSDDYYVEISGACFGNGWDISSVTICGIEVCHIIMQSPNLVAVYPNSGTPGTGDIVITSESQGKTTIENGFTYQVPVPEDQAKNIQYLIVGESSCDLKWTRGTGESCVVFMKEANQGSALPEDHISYDSSIIFGDGTQIGTTGWFCVYNGNGASVSISGLIPGKDYIAQVFEYNGQAGFETYRISPAEGNPKTQKQNRSIIQFSSSTDN